MSLADIPDCINIHVLDLLVDDKEGTATATVHRFDRRETVSSIRLAGGIVESSGVEGAYAQIQIRFRVNKETEKPQKETEL